MRTVVALVILAGLIGGALGTLVYGDLSGRASASPAGAPASIVSPLDGGGNVRVHEQGTANVNVTNPALLVNESSGRIITLTPPADIGPNLWGFADPPSGVADTSDCRSLTLFATRQGLVPWEVSLSTGGYYSIYGTLVDIGGIFIYLVPGTSLPVAVPSVNDIGFHNLDSTVDLHIYGAYLYCAH